MRIVYIQYTNAAAYPPLEHSSRILASAGWKVLFLGTGSLGADSLRFLPHPNVTVKQLSFCPAGFRQKIHYLIYCLWVLGWVIAWRPRWVYASDPLSCPIALALSFLPGLRIIYHEHDSPSGSSGNGMSRLPLLTRRWLARRTSCSVLPNKIRAQRFQDGVGRIGSMVLCVWNCPRRDEISAPKAPLESENIWLLYHGSIVPSRLPLTVLTALANLPELLRLRVIGYETAGSSGYLGILRDTARRLGILHRLEILGPVPRFELLQHCRQSDIGLSVMPMTTGDINMLAMPGASNKAFDYLACGLALVVSDSPAWTTLYTEPGYGVACNPDDPESIERALRRLVDDPVSMRSMGERGRQRIDSEWNYETQFAKVLECLNAESGSGPQPQMVRA